MTYYEAAVRARGVLSGAGLLPETATLDADLLARHAAGWDHATWLSRRGEPASSEFLDRYRLLLDRRLTREPVAYIRGVQEFWGREFHVTPAVLIPRPETELLIEQAGVFLRQRPRASVADIGTGSGCLAITIALEHPTTSVFAVDISEDALEVARSNAARLEVHRVQFVHGSLLTRLPHRLDLILANLPYVAERDRSGLAPEVREHEPAVALFGGTDGWHHIRALLEAAPAALSPGGCLMIEIGFGQSDRLATEVEDVSELRLRKITQDLQGIPRVATLTRAR